ncbi:MAG: CoA transferase [Vicinamibacterales bacterium]|nr:CoA transferase [Vicinamibacterales bacterium]HJO38204.1 CoA transferase [Vicinamibacterales bacterium]
MGERYAPKPQVVLSIEQALSMSYATQRFVQLGWRVIRIEATPRSGQRSKGDPNRYIGQPVAGADRHSYFVAPNVGKQALAIDLKQESGRALLHRLVRDLPVDIFCTNTLPARHAPLGFDYATLADIRPELIWCSISAMGLAHPDVPGYDPMMQALCGYMDITGHPDGPPLQCGPPLSDLKAGDETFAQVLLALLERAETGHGRPIDVSMAQGAVSWLQTFLPMLDMGSAADELRRAGNEHRQFIPVNAYPTRDGFVFIAVGSDAQWGRLVERPLFASLALPHLSTNEGRRAVKDELHRSIRAITSGRPTAEVAAALVAAAVPHAPITLIDEVMDLPCIVPALLETTAPDGRRVRLPPPAVSTRYLEQQEGRLPFAPAYGEHTDTVLTEIGLEPDAIRQLRQDGVVA